MFPTASTLRSIRKNTYNSLLRHYVQWTRQNIWPSNLGGFGACHDMKFLEYTDTAVIFCSVQCEIIDYFEIPGVKLWIVEAA